jgi:hypothetical protein
MNGRGVTSYDINKPSHSFTTETSEFDDALLKRNIITFEQAMMRKGASQQEANELAQWKKAKEQSDRNSTFIAEPASTSSKTREDGDSEEEEEEEYELQEYRSRRLHELQYGNVIPISRTEWTEEVNECSHSKWVVILLTSDSCAPNLIPQHLELCRKLEQRIIPHLAEKFQEVKWVRIPSKSAIENWPDDNLPTLFCYRHGKLMQQMVGLGDFEQMDEDYVEYKLGQLGVLETDIDVPRQMIKTHQDAQLSFGSKFQGGMSTFFTKFDDDDYDDVD